MKTLQKIGGFAALYMALAHLIGIVIFLIILHYLSITDPAQRVALNVEKQTIVFSTNLLMYVFFGFALIALSLALYDRLKSSASALMQTATAIGIIWASSLIASGMVANAGLAMIVPLHAKDPAQAALTWQGIEAVANGLGNADGEILGGSLTLLVSLAALRADGLPKGLTILGLLVGAVGIISIVPGLTLEQYGAVVLGAPLYFGRWHKDALNFLSRNEDALVQRPVAIFALGPNSNDEKKMQSSRAQLDTELAKFPWLTPVVVEVFGGKYPAKLRLPESLIASLPASPLHGMQASDVRDWTAIRAWANSVVQKLQPAISR